MKKILASFLCLTLLFSTLANATTYCTDANIGACYLLNEASGNLADSSGNNNTLSIWYGTATYSATGKFGTAVTQANSPFYQTSGWTNVQVALPISIVAWLNPASFATDQMIYANGGYLNQGGFYVGAWMYLYSSGQIQCGYGDNTSGASTAQQTTTSTASISTGTYTHVACVIQGSGNIQIYFNGVNQSVTNSGTGGAISYGGSEDYQVIGRDAYGNVTTNTVTYEELAQFNRVLTSTEINNIMNNGLQSTEGATSKATTLGKVTLGKMN